MGRWRIEEFHTSLRPARALKLGEIVMTPNRSLLCACMLSSAILATTARAQEQGSVPGAINDPSTYQGSMAQQQQSDAQDQQFRQEQEQATQQRQQNYDYAQQSARQTEQPVGRGYGSAPARAPQARGYATAPARGPVGATHMDPSDPAGAALQRGDYATAFRLTHDAAVREGYLNAMKNLGNLYEDGLGTRKNPQLAVQWYRACADLGVVACQVELYRVYWVGIGVQRDPIEAYKWVLIAGRPGGFKQALLAQNAEFQKQNAPSMRQNRALIQSSLNYDQLSEATRRYQLWAPAASIRPPEQAAPPRGR
jgi:hypothetical protein